MKLKVAESPVMRPAHRPAQAVITGILHNNTINGINKGSMHILSGKSRMAVMNLSGWNKVWLIHCNRMSCHRGRIDCAPRFTPNQVSWPSIPEGFISHTEGPTSWQTAANEQAVVNQPAPSVCWSTVSHTSLWTVSTNSRPVGTFGTPVQFNSVHTSSFSSAFAAELWLGQWF